MYSLDTDRYQSYDFLDSLSKRNIQISMSAKSSPWQNGAQKSYYENMKIALLRLNNYRSFEECIEAIYHQTYYYNHKRMHTKIRMSPVQFHEQHRLKLNSEAAMKLIAETEEKPRALSV